jgi:quercetin dioxygenase-like cupin family protein
MNDKQARSVEEVKLEVLQRSALETLKEGEAIVSLVEIPPDTVLPWHYHPGEEFIYVLEGAGTLQQQDKPDTLLTKGTIFKVPFKQVHTAKTGNEGVRALVFRIHKKGEPERIPVDND